MEGRSALARPAHGGPGEVRTGAMQRQRRSAEGGDTGWCIAAGACLSRSWSAARERRPGSGGEGGMGRAARRRAASLKRDCVVHHELQDISRRTFLTPQCTYLRVRRSRRRVRRYEKASRLFVVAERRVRTSSDATRSEILPPCVTTSASPNRPGAPSPFLHGGLESFARDRNDFDLYTEQVATFIITVHVCGRSGKALSGRFLSR